MVDHIHILGASGSGASTLGDALARSFGYVHLDTDDYFWEPTTPPFQQPRERQRRQALLGAALDAHPLSAGRSTLSRISCTRLTS
jgi:adenylate kinase family enzyme